MKSWRSRAQRLVPVLSQRLEIDRINSPLIGMLMSEFGTSRNCCLPRVPAAYGSKADSDKPSPGRFVSSRPSSYCAKPVFTTNERMSEHSVIAWDLETVPDLKAVARMIDMEGEADEKVRAALDRKSTRL